jgi:hypothetical protein
VGSVGVAVATTFQERMTRVIVAPAFWARATDARAFSPPNAPGSRKPVLSGPPAVALESTTRARASVDPMTPAKRTGGSVEMAAGVSAETRPELTGRTYSWVGAVLAVPKIAILIAGSPNAAFYSQVAAISAALRALPWARWEPAPYLYLGCSRPFRAQSGVLIAAITP